MTLEQVNKRLSERMNARFEQVFDYSSKKNLTMRQAAMDIAVGRVIEATDALGSLP
jgi:glutamate dehydrogenase/leucine dehydrogenase